MSKIYLFVSSSKQFITLFLTLGEGKKYWIRDFVNVILFVAKSTIIFNLTSLSIHKMQIFHAKKITLFSLPQLVGPIGPNFSIDAKSARVNLGYNWMTPSLHRRSFYQKFGFKRVEKEPISFPLLHTPSRGRGVKHVLTPLFDRRLS